jgi:hypothetical protein
MQAARRPLYIMQAARRPLYHYNQHVNTIPQEAWDTMSKCQYGLTEKSATNIYMLLI